MECCLKGIFVKIFLRTSVFLADFTTWSHIWFHMIFIWFRFHMIFIYMIWSHLELYLLDFFALGHFEVQAWKSSWADKSSHEPKRVVCTTCNEQELESTAMCWRGTKVGHVLLFSTQFEGVLFVGSQMERLFHGPWSPLLISFSFTAPNWMIDENDRHLPNSKLRKYMKHWRRLKIEIMQLDDGTC